MKELKVICLFMLIFVMTGCKREDRIITKTDSSCENVQQNLEKEDIKDIDKKQSDRTIKDDDKKQPDKTIKDDTQNNFAKEVKQKELDEARKTREDSILSNPDGTLMGVETKYESKLDEEFPLPDNSVSQTKQCYNAAIKYLKEKLKIEPKTKLELYRCYDKDILKIYTDKDRGYMKDYSGDNIYVLEYQTDDGKWSFIFMGRKDKDSDWKVIHSGEMYK